MAQPDDALGWVGSTLEGRFTVEAVVGEGGFGTVYRGVHLALDETVAIKCLRLPGSLDAAGRAALIDELRREAKLLHRLSKRTAAIVQALDLGAATSPQGVWTPFLIMEWLEGKSLEVDLSERRVRGGAAREPTAAIELLAPIARALSVAHREQVAHLDVKPANIFLTAEGPVKLLDFGIARTLSGNENVSQAIGEGEPLSAFTPRYAAPEQFNRRHGPLGPWSDVFALALVLVELCSGEPALVGDSPLQLYVASANEGYRPSLAAHGVRVGRGVEELVRRALDVDPHRRPQDAGTMWDELQRAAAAPALLSTATLGSAARATGSAPAARKAGEPAPSAGLSRVCTVMCCELTIAEELARALPREELETVVARCSEQIAARVEALGGSIEQALEGRMMAAFGLYGESAGASERAVRAAMLAQEHLTDAAAGALAGAISLRVGVSTGRVYLGATQATRGFRLRLSGPALAQADQLREVARPGAVLIDRDTNRLLSGVFDTSLSTGSERHQQTTKTFRVEGLSAERHALQASVERTFCGLDTTMVGRAAEMESLGAAAETARSEPCARMVTLVGPPGIGKSRLLVELAEGLARDGWQVLGAPGSTLRTRSSYALASALIRSRFHIHEDDADEVVRSKLARGLDELHHAQHPARSLRSEWLELEAREVVEQLARLVGSAEEPAAALEGEEEDTGAKHRIAAAVSAMIRLAPTALVCDDLQWADDASLSLLEDLCLRLDDRTLLVVGASRPELFENRPEWGSGESWQELVRVGPLPPRHLEAMARDRLRLVADLPDEAVRRLVEHADRIPMVLVETLHLLVDLGAIDTRDASWTIDLGHLDQLSLPTTVHGIVQARLDRLDETARTTLARAAVVGRTFWDGALSRLERAEARQGFEGSLQRLVERGFVRPRSSSTFPEERELVFADAVTQRVSYEMVGRTERRRLHRLVATWLEERGVSDASLVASHHERAGSLRLALAAHRRSGAHAAALGQAPDALRSYERARRLEAVLLGEPLDPAELLEWQGDAERVAIAWQEQVALRSEHGDVLRRAGRYDEADRCYTEARRRIDLSAARREVDRWRARLDYRRAFIEKHRGALEEARELLASATTAAAAAGLGLEQAEMLALAASLHRRAGELVACREACLTGLRVCRLTVDRDHRWRQAVSKLLNALGTSFFGQRRLIPAERCYLQAARVIDDRNNPAQASQALNNVAAIRYTKGDLTGAREWFSRALAMAERSGDLWMKLTTLGNLGEVLLGLRRHRDAYECLHEATRLAEQIRAHLDAPEFYRHLAAASLALGELEPAIEAILRAAELLRSSGGETYLAGVLETASTVLEEAQREGEAAAGNERLAALALALEGLLGRVASSLEPDAITRLRGLVAAARAV